MHSYFGCFPGKAKTELRTVTFTGLPGDPIPPGGYLFDEYFCTDRKCHCQRVIIKVLRAENFDARPEEVATISYTWNLEPDKTWAAVNQDMPNPFLDPLHRQARYAVDLMDFWNDRIVRDPAYLERIKRHYDELRAVYGCRPPEVVGARVLTKADKRERQRKLEQFNRQKKAR